MALIKDINLYDIFVGSSHFEIPIYQRNYTWDGDDCIKFLNDIYENYKLNRDISSTETIDYYVGNIIIFNPEIDHMVVVDGQQRLTTSLLIYAALRNFAISLDSGNKNWCAQYIDPLLYCSGLNNSVTSKMNNIRNEDFLNEIISNSEIMDKDNVYYKNYLSILEYISKKYIENKNIIQDIFNSMKTTLLVRVTIKQYDNPNKLFEIINTTGKKLSAVDLIKNYIFFYSTRYAKRIKDLLKIYDQIEKNLDNDDKNFISFYRFLIPILSGKHKFKLKKENNLEIYSDFKKLFEGEHIFSKYNRENYDDVEKITKIILEHSKIWNFIKNYNAEQNVNQYYYNVFNSSFNTYYSMIHHYLWQITAQNESTLVAEMPTILRVVSRLIYSILFTSKASVAKQSTNLFHNYLSFLDEGNNVTFEQWLTDIEQNFIMLNKENINKYINNTNIYNASENRCKWLLIGIEMINVNWESKLDDKVLSIEHIMPQTIRDNSSYRLESLMSNDNDIDKAKEWENRVIDTLPNLTIVTQKLNSEMQNKDFDDKKQKLYKNSNFILNKKIQEYQLWNSETIENRSKWLVDNICKLLEI